MDTPKNNSSDSRAHCEELFQTFPPSLPRERIRTLYGAEIHRMVESTAALLSRPTATDVVISVLRTAGRRALRLVSHAADIVANGLPPVGLQPAMAVRGMGMPPAAPSAEKVEIAQTSGSATLRVVVEATGDHQDARIRLEDGNGAVTGPMELTVIDLDTDKELLDARRFESGEAVLRGIDAGQYLFLAEGDNGEAVLSLRIESAGK